MNPTKPQVKVNVQQNLGKKKNPHTYFSELNIHGSIIITRTNKQKINLFVIVFKPS